MKRVLRGFATAWPWATLMSCLFVGFAFIDGHAHEWGWAVSEAAVAAFWFLVAHHSWEQS